MPRTDRLFRLLQAFRVLPQPVTAARLAAETEVSERTLYRDIAALRAAGARIEGAAGAGYTMAEDVALPPQNLSRLEIEALSIGLSEVAATADAELAAAARDALAKITARLPDRQQREAAHAVSLVRRFAERPDFPVDPGVLRRAAWDEVCLDIRYRDLEGRETARRVKPLALVYLDRTDMLLAWCCLREDFRTFHQHAILAAARTDESFRPHRVTLLRDYVARMTARRADAHPSSSGK